LEGAVFAVVRTGGKQYRVQEGRPVTIERLPGEAGRTVELNEVLLLADGEDVTVGTPTVEGARVVGTIATQGRAKKILVFRYKNKTRARKKNGHRQQFTTLMVDDVLGPGQQPKAKVDAAAPALDEPAAAPRRRRGRKVAETAAVESAAPEAAASEAAAPEAAASEAAAPEAAAPEAVADDAPVEPAEKPKRTRRKAE
jgi:large subunit ribosomal protein L21